MSRKAEIKHTIDVGTGRIPADLIIKNAKIVDVFNKTVFDGNLAIAGNRIAGFVDDKAKASKTVNAHGSYIVPGLINGHVHIESSHCSPSEYARLVVPCGTTTSIADPHEICNVCGLNGLEYMLKASEDVGMDIFFMVPSCVPATDFEHSGYKILAKDIKKVIDNPRVLGLGELMNVPGVCYNDDLVIDKIVECERAGKHIDGHSPAIKPNEIDAYYSTLVMSDHESETGEELQEKVRRGCYVMLRQGSTCKNLLNLLPGVTKSNISHCLFCTDDKHPESILKEGDIDNNVRMAIKAGMDPLDAIQMATINGALCHRLYDRGAIAPGYKADFILVKDLKSFKIDQVYTNGVLRAKNGKFLYATKAYPIDMVGSSMNVQPLKESSFDIKLKSNKVRCIDILPGGVVTGEFIANVETDSKGNMICNDKQDICKIAVIERHHSLPYMSVAPIHNYGLRGGAIASTIAHDSHNLMVVGDNNRDMLLAAKTAIKLGGGQVIVKDGKVLKTFAHPIAGLMTTMKGEEVAKLLKDIHKTANKELHVNKEIDPLMTLCFMALPVIPKLKITDSGLFDYNQFKFVPIEV